MTAQQTNDDDIIDLTELVKAGNLGVAEANAPEESSTALGMLNAPLPDNLEEGMDRLLVMEKRLIRLESRMDNLVLQFSDRVEKAAAIAAARILREELAALLRS